MQIKKTVGQPKLGGRRKHYVIHTTCGEKFYCKPIGSRSFECGGINYGSIKAIKAAILNNETRKRGI